MKRTLATSPTLLVLALGASVLFLTGCADLQTTETKSLLSAAGFRVLTPQTARQKEIYAALPANKIERAHVRGTVIYVYKDENAGVAYVGRESEYQRYQQLCGERHVDQEFFTAHEMDPLYAHRWYGAWNPRVVWR